MPALERVIEKSGDTPLAVSRFNSNQVLRVFKLLTPLILGAVFLGIHRLVPDSRPVFFGDYLSPVFIILALAYILVLILGTRRPELLKKIQGSVPLISALLLGIITWEMATTKLGLLPMPFFPAPGGVLAVFFRDWSMLGLSIVYSLRLLGLGYLIGLLVGLPTGIFMGWSARFNYWVTPVLKLIGPIPSTAWIPITLVVFPTSFAASVFIIALAAWFPITVMAWSGIANVNKSYYEVARTLGGNSRYLITKVAIPAALPTIFVGLFMGMGTSFVSLVVGELLGVKAGLGWYIQWAQGWAEYSKVYAALLIMALIFSGLITLLFKLRDRVLVWQKGLIKW